MDHLEKVLSGFLHSVDLAFTGFDLNSTMTLAREGIVYATSNASRMTPMARQLWGHLHYWHALTEDNIFAQSAEMDTAILVSEDPRPRLQNIVSEWFHMTFVPLCEEVLDRCQKTPPAKPVELFRCYMDKLRHLQNLRMTGDKQINARLTLSTQCCIIAKLIWRRGQKFVTTKAIAELHLEHAEICIKLGLYDPAHFDINEVMGYGETSNPRVFLLAAEINLNRGPPGDMSLTLKRHREARRDVESGLKIFPRDSGLISLKNYLDGRIEELQLKANGDSRRPSSSTAPNPCPQSVPSKKASSPSKQEEVVYRRVLDPGQGCTHLQQTQSPSAKEQNQLKGKEIIQKKNETTEETKTVQIKTEQKSNKKRKKVKTKSIPRRRGGQTQEAEATSNETTKSSSKTAKLTMTSPISVPRQAASGGGQPKKKSRRKTESKASVALYQELSAQYTIQFGCNLCTSTKGPRVTWKQVAHNCLAKNLLLQDRNKGEQEWIVISACPLNYQVTDDDDDICEHVRNGEDCNDRKRCPKAHSKIEKLLWEKYFVRKHPGFANFIEDLRNSPLRVRNELGRICHKYEGNFAFICKKCKEKKKSHIPKCLNGHQWKRNCLLVFETTKGEQRFIRFDEEFQTESAEEIQRCLKELTRCGFSEDEIIDESTALVQRRKAMERNAKEPRKSRNRKNPRRRHQYVETYGYEDFDYIHYDADDADYDTDLENILTVCESDEEGDEQEDETQSSKPENLYYEMLSESELLELLRKDPEKYKQCKIHLDGPFAARCKVLDNMGDDNIREILIRGRGNCGQTFEGDEVLVEIKYTEVLDTRREAIETTDKPKDNQTVKPKRTLKTVKVKKTVEEETRGIVKGILKKGLNRKNYTFVCRVDRYHCHLMKPLDGAAPKIHVRHQSHKNDKIFVYKMDENGKLKCTKVVHLNPLKKEKSLFIVKYLKWDPAQIYPYGYVTHVLRAGETLEQSQQVLNILHQVPTKPNKECEQVAESIDPSAYIAEDKEVTDDRKLFIISIDPRNCRDVDDALSIRRTRDGEFLVGVHIADVTSYVDKDDCIDRNARRRTTTYYAATGKAYHMLPSSLSENVCSLREGEDRLAISVFFHISRNTKQLCGTPVIRRSIIRNRKQLTYEEAERYIDSMKTDSPKWKDEDVESAVCHLHILSVILRKNRILEGQFFYDSDDPFDLDHPFESHRLVEEFMLLTNRHIGQYLGDVYQELVPFRFQKPPDEEDLKTWNEKHPDATQRSFYFRQFEILRKQLNSTAMKANVPLLMSTVTALKEAVDKNDIKRIQTLFGMESMHPQHLLSMVAWYRIQSKAEFKCSYAAVDHRNQTTQVMTTGSKNPTVVQGHFSLQMKHYVQFTSPIRRYMDLAIHRFLKAALNGKAPPYDPSEVQAICENTNKIATMSKRFHKACSQLKTTDRFREPFCIPFVIEEIDDNSIKLTSPFLPHLKRERKIAKYSDLLVSRKPEIQDSGRRLELHWERRFYDASSGVTALSIARTTAQTREILELDSERHSAEVSQSTWNRLQGIIAGKKHKELPSVVRKIVEEDKTKKQGSCKRMELTSEMKHGDVLVRHHVSFRQTLKPGTVLRMQVGSECLRGYLEPVPQMLQLTDAKYICLQHRRDPVKCFARTATEMVSKLYDSMDHYQRVWLPIIAMEAATQSAAAGDAIYCSNVPVWLRRRCDQVLEGSLKLPLEFCRKRQIKIYTLEDEEYNSNDYLCIRYRLPPSAAGGNSSLNSGGGEGVWVAHVVSTSNKVKEFHSRKKGDEDDRVVYLEFRVQQYNGTVPEALLVAEEKAKRCDVEFLTKSLPDRRMEEAVKSIDENIGLCYNIVLKRTHPRDDSINFVESENYDLPPRDKVPRNNRCQFRAIRRAVRNPFTVIQGPPGTGKTVTGVKLVYWFVKANRQLQSGEGRRQVLYCGPSNSSVDVAVNLLRKFLGDDRKSVTMIRVYSEMLERQVYPIPRDAAQIRLQKGRKYDIRTNDDNQDIALHNLIRQPHNEHSARILQYDRLFWKNLVTPEEVADKDVETYLKLVTTASIDEIKRYDVIFCTCAASASKKMKAGADIRQIVIDECGMCMEPESLIPLVAYQQATQVVLIGDHKQLQPIVTNAVARDLGMHKSLFERYEDQAIMLEEQYRMHPSICEFPSQMFYGGRLRPAEELLRRQWHLPGYWPSQQHPCTVFIHVEGAERTMSVSTDEGNQQSKSNEAERNEVVRIFIKLANNKGMKMHNIAVLSQYKSQCTEIEKNLKDFGFENPRVSTVVASQGGEWKYVILSLVRSLPLYEIERKPSEGWKKINMGFIVDRHQINVALTRAKIGLIIIGNMHLLRCDEMWNNLLEHYAERNCVLNANQFPPTIERPPNFRRVGLQAGHRLN